ncbi:hypothetical protein LCGC14_2501650, partial [marine sediment metagenome]
MYKVNFHRSETKLQQLLKDIPEPQTSRRMDCPNCGGVNTFSITNLGTIILFYCFKASCKLKGRHQVDASIESIKGAFEIKNRNDDPMNLDKFMFIPETLSRERINRFLHDNNCWDAYREGRADIRYDIREDRVVFMIWKYADTEPVDAVGKKLTTAESKWKRYGKMSVPFICPMESESQSKTLIIVEDCCSACAASAYCD